MPPTPPGVSRWASSSIAIDFVRLSLGAPCAGPVAMRDSFFLRRMIRFYAFSMAAGRAAPPGVAGGQAGHAARRRRRAGRTPAGHLHALLALAEGHHEHAGDDDQRAAHEGPRPRPLAEQQQRVERRAQRLEVAQDRRMLHADAAHALGPQGVGQRRADHAEHDAHDDVAAGHVAAGAHRLPERQRQQHDAVDAHLADHDGDGAHAAVGQVLHDDLEGGVAETRDRAGEQAQGRDVHGLAGDGRPEDGGQAGQGDAQRHVDHGLGAPAKDARRRDRHPDRRHELEEHADRHVRVAQGDEEQQQGQRVDEAHGQQARRYAGPAHAGQRPAAREHRAEHEAGGHEAQHEQRALGRRGVVDERADRAHDQVRHRDHEVAPHQRLPPRAGETGAALTARRRPSGRPAPGPAARARSRARRSAPRSRRRR